LCIPIFEPFDDTDVAKHEVGFSHRRSPSPPDSHAIILSVAVCCVWHSYSAHPTIHCQWG